MNFIMAEPENGEGRQLADNGGEFNEFVLVEEEFMEMCEIGEGVREGVEEIVTGPEPLQA